MKKVGFIYDKNVDSLSIFREDRIPKSSISLGEIIISFDKDRKISSLEILNPDKLYKIPKSQLSRLKSVKMQVSCRGSLSLIYIELEMGKSKKELQVNIPFEKPIMCK